VIRRLFAIAIGSLVFASVSESYPSGTIDLDVPGALEAIERDHPDHFAKIQRILAEVPRQPPNEKSVATWMRTEFQARNIHYTGLVMTSLPPKKRLEFSLDGTSYVKVVTLDWRSKVSPATKGTTVK
jgi:hypothetical protein